uniref:Uncharacterized protein n=1 Tax=Panagrolaimus sp. JU765 TaxID=591449 RepID=A0AC34Q4A8_9BILA
MPDSIARLYYTTCCGCHARKFAKNVGYTVIILSILSSITIFFGNPSAFGTVFGSMIYLICGVCVILADKYEKPYFYLPYLVCSGLGFIGMIFICFLFVIFLISHARSEEEIIKGMIGLFILTFATVLTSYFWYVVKRAKEYMEKEICAPKIPSAPGYVQAVIIEKVNS